MTEITIRNASYRYPGQTERDAISDINATISPGVTLLMGPNGAGKTTLLHLIATLLYPKTGDIRFTIYDGEDQTELPSKGRMPSLMQRIFFLPETLSTKLKSIDEAVKRHAVMYPNFSHEMLGMNLCEFGIDITKPLRHMSLGERKRALLSYSLSLQTDILLLDEPVNGLDMGARDTARMMLAKCIDPENQSVVMSTHTVADFKPLFDAVIHIAKGVTVASAKTWEITERLAFHNDSIPHKGALFTAQDMGMFRTITQAEPDEETDIDLHLLYQALNDPKTSKIITDILNSK